MKSFYLLLLAKITLSQSSEHTSVKRCCPEGYLFVIKNRTCMEPYNHTTTSLQFSCKRLVPYRTNFTINERGDLTFTSSVGTNHTVDSGVYCLGNNTKITSNIDLSKVREIPVLCADPDETVMDPRVLSYCLIISAIFLAITTVVYAVLPELRRDVQGMSLVNFCGSLAIALAMLAILRLVSFSNMSVCAARGFIGYFFVIVSFFWTNAIAVQVLRSVRRPTIVTAGWKEFGWYALYAWGSGALLTICMAIVNFYPGDHEKPGIGLKFCWFFDRRQQWYYMYSVMTILLSVNVCIFVYTSTLIWRNSFSSSNIKALKYKLVMSVRLMIMMGLPWIFEMIIASSDDHIIWAIVNIFNSLQGVLILLLLVVFRKRAVRAMFTHGWLGFAAPLVERYLARCDDDEELAISHTQVPMSDRTGI